MNVHAVFVGYLDGDGYPSFDLIGLGASEAAARALIARAKAATEPLWKDWETSVVSLAHAEVRVMSRRQFEEYRPLEHPLERLPLILIESIEVTQSENAHD
jgi:hypothetical protein